MWNMYVGALCENSYIDFVHWKKDLQKMTIWDDLRDLAPFVQYKKREHSRKSVTFSKLAGFSLQLQRVASKDLKNCLITPVTKEQIFIFLIKIVHWKF